MTRNQNPRDDCQNPLASLIHVQECNSFALCSPQQLCYGAKESLVAVAGQSADKILKKIDNDVYSG